VNRNMSNTKNSNSNGITPSVLAFGAAMFAVGLVLGYMLAPNQQQATPMTVAPTATTAKVVNNTPGELRKLSDQEKRELTRKQKATQNQPAAPADSPFLTDTIKGSFKDPVQLNSYTQAVAYMAKGNARAAAGPLAELESSSKGSAWREQVIALLSEAQAATSRTADARSTVALFKKEFPKSPHMGTVTLAEARAFMQDGKRSPGAGGQGAITDQQGEMYKKAIALFDETSVKWPTDAAAAEALFNKAALQADLGQFTEAQTTTFALVERFPSYRNSPRALSNLGRSALAAGQSDRAQGAYKKLISAFPKDRMAQAARGQLNSIALVGKDAPSLEIEEWLGDDPGSVAALSGRPVLVVFWATWCPHCRREMPNTEETWNKYKDKGLMVVAVTKNSRGQTSDKVREYISENGLTFPIGIDQGGQTSRAYSVQGIPAAALIDKSGKVVVRDHPTRITDEVIAKYL
jgi:peroxiredoxin/outer membrane protein assembly factor BamD (BamD/ComL family)